MKKMLCVSSERKVYFLGMIPPCIFVTDCTCLFFSSLYDKTENFLFNTACVIFAVLDPDEKQWDKKESGNAVRP